MMVDEQDSDKAFETYYTSQIIVAMDLFLAPSNFLVFRSALFDDWKLHGDGGRASLFVMVKCVS